jgi:hypothetical protein
MITPVVHAAGGYSFTYSVQGQTIILEPSVDTSAFDYYKWTCDVLHSDEWFTTRWIPVEDLDTKRMILSYDETYHIELHVKDCTDTYQTGEFIRIGSNHTLTAVNEYTDETEQGIDLFDNIPEPVTHFFNSLHPLWNVLILCVILGLSISFVLWDDRVILFKRIKKK